MNWINKNEWIFSLILWAVSTAYQKRAWFDRQLLSTKTERGERRRETRSAEGEPPDTSESQDYRKRGRHSLHPAGQIFYLASVHGEQALTETTIRMSVSRPVESGTR